MQKKWLLIFFMGIQQLLEPSIKLTIPFEPPSDTHRSLDISVAMHLGAGFFAEMTKVVSSIIHYENDGLTGVYVDWTNEFFPYKDAPHENGWDCYFDPIIIEKQTGYENDTVVPVMATGLHEIHDQKCSSQWLSYDQFLPYRTFVNQKINKYIHIKKNVTNKVDEFYNKNMQNHLCIGVQVRYAQAHVQEVPGGRHPTLPSYCSEVDVLIQKNLDKNIKIYLATDSNVVIDYFKKKYGKKLLYIDAYRASGQEDPGLIYENSNYWLSHPAEWHTKKAGYFGGLTTLMDCLLLARCDYLIHTTSNVSSFVCFFNPTIKSIYLPRNAPYASCRFKDNPNIKNPFLNPI